MEAAALWLSALTLLMRGVLRHAGCSAVSTIAQVRRTIHSRQRPARDHPPHPGAGGTLLNLRGSSWDHYHEWAKIFEDEYRQASEDRAEDKKPVAIKRHIMLMS